MVVGFGWVEVWLGAGVGGAAGCFSSSKCSAGKSKLICAGEWRTYSAEESGGVECRLTTLARSKFSSAGTWAISKLAT